MTILKEDLVLQADVSNAIDGRYLEGVRIRLRENWNNRSGAYYSDYSYVTDSNGRYRIEDIPAGYYTIEAVKDGFLHGLL